MDEPLIDDATEATPNFEVPKGLTEDEGTGIKAAIRKARYHPPRHQVWAGKPKPVIDRVWPLSRARKAHEAMESGDLFGNLLFTP